MFLNMVWKTFHDKYGNYPLRPIPPSHSNLLLTVMKLLENPFVPTTDCYSICQNRAGLRLGESITCMKKEAENTRTGASSPGRQASCSGSWPACWLGLFCLCPIGGSLLDWSVTTNWKTQIKEFCLSRDNCKAWRSLNENTDQATSTFQGSWGAIKSMESEGPGYESEGQGTCGPCELNIWMVQACRISMLIPHFPTSYSVFAPQLWGSEWSFKCLCFTNYDSLKCCWRVSYPLRSASSRNAATFYLPGQYSLHSCP